MYDFLLDLMCLFELWGQLSVLEVWGSFKVNAPTDLACFSSASCEAKWTLLTVSRIRKQLPTRLEVIGDGAPDSIPLQLHKVFK